MGNIPLTIPEQLESAVHEIEVFEEKCPQNLDGLKELVQSCLVKSDPMAKDENNGYGDQGMCEVYRRPGIIGWPHHFHVSRLLHYSNLPHNLAQVLTIAPNGLQVAYECFLRNPRLNWISFKHGYAMNAGTVMIYQEDQEIEQQYNTTIDQCRIVQVGEEVPYQLLFHVIRTSFCYHENAVLTKSDESWATDDQASEFISLLLSPVYLCVLPKVCAPGITTIH